MKMKDYVRVMCVGKERLGFSAENGRTRTRVDPVFVVGGGEQSVPFISLH